MNRKLGGMNRFTLIELLVCIAIIAVLMSLLLPSLRSARDMARRSACAGNLKTVGLGVLLYAADSNDYMPYNDYCARFWYVPDFTGLIGDGSAYLKQGDASLYCPTLGKVDANYMSYNIFAFSDTSASMKSVGHWANHLISYGQVSLTRLTLAGMPTGSGNAVPQEFSRRALAGDYFYCKSPYWGASVYTNQAGAHDFKGANTVFADGHVRWSVNPLARTPLSYNDSLAMGSYFYTFNWSQRPYVAVYDGVYGK